MGYAPGVTEKMYQADYWTAMQKDSEQLQMTESEIIAWNQIMNRCKELGMNDIQNLYGTTYGICVKETSVKSMPEKHVVSDIAGDDYFDDLRRTSIKVNTPVLINSVAKNGSFYHIVKTDYEGWVEREAIAICTSREEWLRAQEMKDFLIVTSPKRNLEVTNQILTMGTRLSVCKGREREWDTFRRSNWGCYTVKMPVRDDTGHYAVRELAIPAYSSVHIGYMPYTKANLWKLAFQYLGNAYGWGGMYHSVDCSGMIQDIYACFGLAMPRDSDNQAKMQGNTIGFNEQMSEKDRQTILDYLPSGTQLFFPGHTMLYLGKVEGAYYVISSVGTIMSPYIGEEAFDVRSVIINTLSLKRKNGSVWMNAITKSFQMK